MAIANWLYKIKPGDLTLVPNVPRKVKERLKEISSIGVFGPVSSVRSIDGTVKFLFRNESGQEFETVLMSAAKRITVFLSLVGLQDGMPVLVTGQYGFKGDLSARIPDSGSRTGNCEK